MTAREKCTAEAYALAGKLGHRMTIFDTSGGAFCLNCYADAYVSPGSLTKLPVRGEATQFHCKKPSPAALLCRHCGAQYEQGIETLCGHPSRFAPCEP